MKRIFVLLVVALMSTMVMSAKSVRGFVSDVNGDPVAGVKMLVANAETTSRGLVMTETDEEGYFQINVPDDLDVENLLEVFTRRGAKLVQYWIMPSGALSIMIDPAQMK